MSAFETRRFTKGKMSTRNCSNGCSRSASVVVSIMGVDKIVCRVCGAADRKIWNAAAAPAAPRCNDCQDGRLLPGAPGGLVPLLTCVDCGRQVHVAAMRSAA